MKAALRFGEGGRRQRLAEIELDFGAAETEVFVERVGAGAHDVRPHDDTGGAGGFRPCFDRRNQASAKTVAAVGFVHHESEQLG